MVLIHSGYQLLLRSRCLLLTLHMPKVSQCCGRMVGQPPVPGMSLDTTSFTGIDVTSNAYLTVELSGQNGSPEVSWPCVSLVKCLDNCSWIQAVAWAPLVLSSASLPPQQKALPDALPRGTFGPFVCLFSSFSLLVFPSRILLPCSTHCFFPGFYFSLCVCIVHYFYLNSILWTCHCLIALCFFRTWLQFVNEILSSQLRVICKYVNQTSFHHPIC